MLAVQGVQGVAGSRVALCLGAEQRHAGVDGREDLRAGRSAALGEPEGRGGVAEVEQLVAGYELVAAGQPDEGDAWVPNLGDPVRWDGVVGEPAFASAFPGG